ncbi:hypothetical protein R3P38DRAFT_3147510 [Favolaschia claudopus]|uniref:BTB domain-containing protein n=1 Tax=Favolaschia claudopus TaxID=2862362 RepID=A0AAV9Z2B6_9AGAR
MEIAGASPSTSPDSEELIRAEGLWFEDCGLIIRAENTLFRISRDFLAVQSPVFKDMLSLPPPKSTEMIDGCPFVVLPDRAEDVTVFLKALIYYDFFLPHPGYATLPTVASVLKMSDKYQVDALRKRALVHLSSAFPTTLPHYEARILTRPSVSDVQLVLALARDLSIDWILPVALYWRCEHLSMNRNQLEESFSISEQSQLLTATCSLTSSVASAILDFLLPSALEEGHAQCLASTIRRRRDAEAWRADVMPFEIWDGDDWYQLNVCAECKNSMQREERLARQAVWNNLPEVFGLSPWTELEKMKTEAFE